MESAEEVCLELKFSLVLHSPAPKGQIRLRLHPAPMHSLLETEWCVISIFESGGMRLRVGPREKSSYFQKGMIFLCALEAKMYAKQMNAN